MEERWNYKKAGVDIDLGDKLIQEDVYKRQLLKRKLKI